MYPTITVFDDKGVSSEFTVRSNWLDENISSITHAEFHRDNEEFFLLVSGKKDKFFTGIFPFEYLEDMRDWANKLKCPILVHTEEVNRWS